MIQLLRLLKGYVEFCADGGFPERFINLCKIKGINLWNLKNDGVKVFACTTEAEFNELNLPAENSGMTINIVKSRGLKSFLKRHKWRCGVALGIFATFLFWFFMSGFIWEIEIAEMNTVKVEDFAEGLAELGVKVGARKSEIDIIEVQNQLMNKYKELLWVSVNIFGGKVKVEVSEFIEQKEILDTRKPVNLVAYKKGEIVLVKGYKGVNMVKEGDSVTQGALLISGVGQNADGSEYFIHAKGQVFARTQNNEKVFCRMKNNLQTSFESDSRYILYIFSLKLPFGFKTKGNFLSESQNFLKSGETLIPFGIIREDSFKAENREIVYNKNEAVLQALMGAVELKRRDYNENNLEKVEYIKKNCDNGVEICARIFCTEDIAKESPILTE